MVIYYKIIIHFIFLVRDGFIERQGNWIFGKIDRPSVIRNDKKPKGLRNGILTPTIPQNKKDMGLEEGLSQ